MTGQEILNQSLANEKYMDGLKEQAAELDVILRRAKRLREDVEYRRHLDTPTARAGLLESLEDFIRTTQDRLGDIGESYESAMQEQAELRVH